MISAPKEDSPQVIVPANEHNPSSNTSDGNYTP